MSLAFSLPGALAYGVADFTGGLVTRRRSVLLVTGVAQVAGLVALLPAALLVPGTPSMSALTTGALAAAAGTTAVMLYLRGLAIGPMGVVAPLSAVLSAGLPLLIGLVTGERPGPLALVGVGVALVAILLAGVGTGGGTGGRGGIALGLAAGTGFGLYFVALDASPADSGLWPLLAGRLVSSVVLALVLCARPTDRRGAGGVGLMVTSGVFDTGANVLFLLATRVGDLGITAVVVSLYPVVVVLLARIVLRERLTVLQLAGAGLALGAGVLLAAAG